MTYVFLEIFLHLDICALQSNHFGFNPLIRCLKVTEFLFDFLIWAHLGFDFHKLSILGCDDFIHVLQSIVHGQL